MDIQTYIDKLVIDSKRLTPEDLLFEKSLKNLFSCFDSTLKVVNDPVYVACGAPNFIIQKKSIPIGFINIIPQYFDLKKYRPLEEKTSIYRSTLYNFINTNLLEFQYFNNGSLKKEVKIAENLRNPLSSMKDNFEDLFNLLKSFCDYQGPMYSNTSKLNGILNHWTTNSEKNDQIVNDYLLHTAEYERHNIQHLQPRNFDALEMFVKRTTDAESICNYIWRLEEGYCSELRILLGIGLLKGEGAHITSKKIQNYIENPEAIFRRKRSTDGEMVLNPDCTISSFNKELIKTSKENAFDLMASLTNQSFLLADQRRNQQTDMVIGYKISKSGSHKKIDICDELEGIYPKTFLFTGWHWGCHCHITPVLSSSENFLAYLSGDEQLDTKPITNMPENFVKYVDKNKEVISLMKYQPNWVTDNFINGDIKKGLKLY